MGQNGYNIYGHMLWWQTHACFACLGEIDVAHVSIHVLKEMELSKEVSLSVCMQRRHEFWCVLIIIIIIIVMEYICINSEVCIMIMEYNIINLEVC